MARHCSDEYRTRRLGGCKVFFSARFKQSDKLLSSPKGLGCFFNVAFGTHPSNEFTGMFALCGDLEPSEKNEHRIAIANWPV
jgi:hypothetical protein